MLKKLLPFLFFSFAACHHPEPVSTQPTVLVSVAPYAYFVHRIAGPELDVQILVPEDSNPHVYEPKPRQVEALSSAKLWIRLGDPADQKIYQVFKERHQDMKIVDVAEGIELISDCAEQDHRHHCDHEGGDLHIWLSPRLAKIQAATIARGLIETFPEKKEKYEENLQAFLTELSSLDQEITALLLPKAGDAILVSHPAFAYFCRDYHLTQLSIEIEGKDPLPQHITALLERAKQLNTTAVLLQPQYSNKGAQLIAAKLQLPIAMVNPYAEDYVDNLRHIAEIIANIHHP